jgi:hypothetical protein
VFVERELGDQTLQPSVLITQLTYLPDFLHAELALRLFPQVEDRLAHAQLPAHVDHGRPAFSLAQRVGDLLFR